MCPGQEDTCYDKSKKKEAIQPQIQTFIRVRAPRAGKVVPRGAGGAWEGWVWEEVSQMG